MAFEAKHLGISWAKGIVLCFTFKPVLVPQLWSYSLSKAMTSRMTPKFTEPVRERHFLISASDLWMWGEEGWKAKLPPCKDFSKLKKIKTAPNISLIYQFKQTNKKTQKPNNTQTSFFFSRLRGAAQADYGINELVCALGNSDSDPSPVLSSTHLGCWLLFLYS